MVLYVFDMKTLPLSLMVLSLAACSAAPSDPTSQTSQAVTHSDGFGQTWTDSSPAGTLSVDEALAACAAFVAPSSPNLCVPVASCNGSSTSLVTTFGPNPPNDVWGWIYGGPNAGGAVHVTSSCVQGTPNACQVASRAEVLCLNAGVILPSSEVQPPITIVGRWQ